MVEIPFPFLFRCRITTKKEKEPGDFVDVPVVGRPFDRSPDVCMLRHCFENCSTRISCSPPKKKVFSFPSLSDGYIVFISRGVFKKYKGNARCHVSHLVCWNEPMTHFNCVARSPKKKRKTDKSGNRTYENGGRSARPSSNSSAGGSRSQREETNQILHTQIQAHFKKVTIQSKTDESKLYT